MNLKEIKDLCRRYNIRPHRKRGQNFLISEDILKLIIKEANIHPDEEILEIGGGFGFLTYALSLKGKRIWTVELDFKIVNFLRKRFKNKKNVKVIRGDIFQVRKELPLDNFGYKVVANLPYSITGRFLREFLEMPPKPKEMVIMLQKEVAEKITQKPPKSFLGLMVQYFSSTYLIKIISKDNFWPKPDVDSGLVKLTLKQKEPLTKLERGILFSVAKKAFGQKRKMMINSLKDYLNLPKEEIKKLLLKAGLNEKNRPEELKLENWLCLVKLLKDILTF